MIVTPQPPQDTRDYLALFAALRARAAGYTPGLQLSPGTAGAALGNVFSRFVETVLQRMNQAPDKNRLAFYDQLGLDLTPARSARAVLVFTLTDKATAGIAPAATAVAAPPPAGSNQQIVFETAQDVSIMAGKLKEVCSLWPGSDTWINHTSDFLAGKPIILFNAAQLDNIPHHLYLAHSTLFALSGTTKLNIEVTFLPPGTQALDILWEFWDGSVWRNFFDISAACHPDDPAPPDGTAGMTENGRIVLESDGAKSDKTTINGYNSYWLRGRVTTPLPGASDAGLPMIDSIRLSSTVEQAFRAVWTVSYVDGRLKLHVRNAATQPLDARASIDVNGKSLTLSGSGGVFDIPDADIPDSVTVTALGLSHTVSVAPNIFVKKELNIDVDLIGIAPDTALSGTTPLDTTKPFFPFGQQPQPGAAFHFSNQEALSKPGAVLQVWLPLTVAPVGSTTSTDPKLQPNPLTPLIEWEYWNGRVWTTLIKDPSNQGAGIFGASEILAFTVPSDIASTKVGGTDGLWIRARLVAGGFGYLQQVNWQAGSGPTNTFTYVVNVPPVLAGIQLAYTWQYGPFRPDRVVTWNDFQYKDRTDAASWPGQSFPPFERTADVTPTLYLGFDQQPPEGEIGILFNTLEDPTDERGPALTWEYWNGSAWIRMVRTDETQNLRLPGIVGLLTQDDSAALTRFDSQALYWFRGRLKDDGPPGSPTIKGIYPNAVWASQQTTLSDQPIGQSSGAIDQTFAIPQIPILTGERIEVQEISGARANVEWRILALGLLGGDAKRLEALETRLAAEGSALDVIDGDLRLRRDRLKRVAGVWVKWYPVETLAGSQPDARVYTLDRARGILTFGDGTEGRVPPNAAPILARTMQSGGGAAGNVAAASITQLRGVVPGIASISNPLAAEGGSDGEALSQFIRRAPKSVRHRGRATGVDDYATLAREASSAVGFARAIPTRDPGGHIIPGWVTIIVIPQSLDAQPQPSFGLREEVRLYTGNRGPAELNQAERIFVTGPNYQPIDVSATLSPATAPLSGSVEQAARDAIAAFLHPLTGGPNGEGWDLGRSIFVSDVAAALARVPNIDHIDDLTLLLSGQPQGASIAVDDGRIPAAGTIHITLSAPPS